MCGIAGIIDLDGHKIEGLQAKLERMNQLIAHRGPDGYGYWQSQDQSVGLTHRRLSIIDLTTAAKQPMIGPNQHVLTYNGEIYNYLELMQSLASTWQFTTHSDTETILAAYQKMGPACVDVLRGMFAFALWDGEQLFCARDRFGIKPFYYAVINRQLYFASEAKAIAAFLPSVTVDEQALSEYFTFQYPVSDKTLFAGIYQLLPGQFLTVKHGEVTIKRYWDVHYQTSDINDPDYFNGQLEQILDESVAMHLRSDVELGTYLSGGIDSSLISALAAKKQNQPIKLFHGRFTYGDAYDESSYAKALAAQVNGDLKTIDIQASDFTRTIHDIIYHLDYPVAGPGAFPQYLVSQLASQHVKVVLGGQGGDEIFGGYARYVIAYFDQCIRAGIEGDYQNENFPVTPESLFPNLGLLKEYKPLIKQFWKEGLFESIDKRYFRLVDRSVDFNQEVDWQGLDMPHVYQQFANVFNAQQNVNKNAYFDNVMHFDFKCLLPSLLQVEDRVSMAHGLEARVPLLDHKVVEFMATVPAHIKFSGGRMKHMLRETYGNIIPKPILNRRDKMGFPVPLNEWMRGELKDFVIDIFNTGKARHRPFINYDAVIREIESTSQFSRKMWAFLSLELWYQRFYDAFTKNLSAVNTTQSAVYINTPVE